MKLVRVLVALTLFGAASLAGSGGAGAQLGPIQISPTEGPPGTVITVTGTGCAVLDLVLGGEVEVVLVNEDEDLLDDQTVSADLLGNWTVQLTVPADYPAPDLLGVGAECDVLGEITEYDPQLFNVTGTLPPPPPVNPVVRRPTFTG